MKKVHWVVGLILCFSIIAAWLISSFEIAMYWDYSVYEKEYRKYDVLSDLEMTMDDTMYVTREMMEYLRGNRDELSVITEVEGEMQDFFNDQDRFHMGEVRGLFIGGLNIRKVSFILAVLCIIFLLVTKAQLFKVVSVSYRIAVGVTAVTALLLGIACAVDFNAVFTQFHHIFFDNDLWLFDPAYDYMIRMLPEGLFFDMVIRIGIIFIGGLLILFLLSFVQDLLRRKQN